MSLPSIIDNVLFNTITWILLLYTFIVVLWEIFKRIIKRFRGLNEEGSSNSSNEKG